MIQLNLLPDSAKRGLRWKLLARDFYVLSFFAFLWLVVAGVMVGVSFQYLSIQNGALKERLVQVEQQDEVQEVQKLESQIAVLNVQLDTIGAIQRQKKHDAVELLERIAPLVPAGSNLEQLTIATETSTVTLRGHAGLRSQVVTLQTRLEENTLFEDVDFPLSNITKPEDINFTFTLTLRE